MRISSVSAAAAAVVGVGALAYWYIKSRETSSAPVCAESECATAAIVPSTAEPVVAAAKPVAVAPERTLLVLKHEALQRKLIGRVIQKLEARGFRLVGLKLAPPPAAGADAVDGPVVAMVWQGKSVAATVPQLVGSASSPADASTVR